MSFEHLPPIVRSQRSRSHASVAAFTLIEILVVLMIIGIISTVTVLAMGDNRRDKLQEEALRLQAVMKMAQEEAQLYGVELGLQVSPHDYQFVTFGRDRWTAIADDKAYKKHRLDDEFQLALKIEGFKLGKQNGMLPGADIKDGKVVVREEDDDDKPDDKAGQEKDDADEQDDDATSIKTPDKDDGKSIEGVNARNPMQVEKMGKDGKKKKSLLPQVFLLSSGEINPFTLTIGSSNDPAIFYRLKGSFDGSILIEGPIDGDLIADMNKEIRHDKDDEQNLDERKDDDSRE